ncbi:hypothetical protein D4R89_06280 [bacterium]|nr:MAG: hypothetical protein D4R89_06280 [bacterium]
MTLAAPQERRKTALAFRRPTPVTFPCRLFAVVKEHMHYRILMTAIVLVVALAISTIATAQERVIIFVGAASSPDPGCKIVILSEARLKISADILTVASECRPASSSPSAGP